MTPTRAGRLALDPARRSGGQRAADRAASSRLLDSRAGAGDRHCLAARRRMRRSCASSSTPRVRFEDLPPHRPAGLEGAADGAGAGRVHRLGRDRVGEDPPRGGGCEEDHPMDSREAPAGGGALRRRSSRRRRRYAARSIGSISHPWAERLFDRYRPSLLVASSPGLIFSEVPLLRTARAARRPVDGGRSELGQLHEQADSCPPRQSADRLERPDEAAGGRLCTATRQTRSASPARRSGTCISATARSSPRDAFFRQIGADPSRKLDHVTTTPRELYPHHDHVLRVLIRAMAERRLAAAGADAGAAASPRRSATPTRSSRDCRT